MLETTQTSINSEQINKLYTHREKYYSVTKKENCLPCMHPTKWMDLKSNLLSGGKTAYLKGYIHSILRAFRNEKIRAMEC